MTRRVFAALPLSAFLLAAGPKKTTAAAKGENEDLILTATLYIDPQEIKQLVGSDLEATSSSPRLKSSRSTARRSPWTPTISCFGPTRTASTPALRSQSGGRQEHHDHHASQRDTAGRRFANRTDVRRHAVPLADRWGILRTASEWAPRLGRSRHQQGHVHVTSDEQDNPLEKALDAKCCRARRPSSPSPACSASRWKSKK